MIAKTVAVGTKHAIKPHVSRGCGYRIGCDRQRLIMTAHTRVHASGEIQGHEIVGNDLEGLVEFTQPFFRPSSMRARELRGEVLFDAVFLDRVQQASDGDQMSLPEGRKLAQ